LPFLLALFPTKGFGRHLHFISTSFPPFLQTNFYDHHTAWMEVDNNVSVLSVMTWTTHRTRPEFDSESSKTRPAPIELQTENGFAIVRRCDLDQNSSTRGTEHFFVVRDPYGYELDITVDFSDAAIAEAIARSNRRLTLSSAYWITTAEHHLADYLWEADDYPREGKITIDYLTPDDVDLARRWATQIPPAIESAPASTFRATAVSIDGNGAKPKTQPIKVVTENGYTIMRLGDIDQSIGDTPDGCHFRVTNPNGVEREINVRFDRALVTQIQDRRRRGQLTAASKYWPVMAEKILADYVWRHGDFPPAGDLRIDQLDVDDLLLGAHWLDPSEGM
jgi:hypothetical protein